MIDLSLSDEQRALRETAREFAQRELAPAVALAREADEPWPLLRDAYARGCKLGFQSLLVSAEDGGVGASCIDAALVWKELGAVDVAAAACRPRTWSAERGRPGSYAYADERVSWGVPIRPHQVVARRRRGLAGRVRGGEELLRPGAQARARSARVDARARAPRDRAKFVEVRIRR